MDSSCVCSPSKHDVNFEAHLFLTGALISFSSVYFIIPLCSISLS